jgi:hypothetical protein
VSYLTVGANLSATPRGMGVGVGVGGVSGLPPDRLAVLLLDTNLYLLNEIE